MRDKNLLFAFDDIALLQQYLYLDGGHKIRVKNTLGVALELSMDGYGRVWSQNMDIPEAPPLQQDPSPSAWMGIIRQLKAQPLEEFAGFSAGGAYRSRWDEIGAITKANLHLNLEHA